MTLIELLPILREKQYSSLLVTGPQRSGTTVTAHILADELQYRYVDEAEIFIESKQAAAHFLTQPKVVLQAPGLCHVAQQFGCPVIMMRRAVEDILNSQRRIAWEFEDHELSKYPGRKGPICEIKYQCWDDEQKHFCVSYDLDYESLSEHRLWVPPKERLHFASRQWF